MGDGRQFPCPSTTPGQDSPQTVLSRLGGLTGERARVLFFFKFLFCFFFDVDHFLKVFIESGTILLLSYVLVFWLCGMWDLSSPTRDRTRTPCIGRGSLNHWTAREGPSMLF